MNIFIPISSNLHMQFLYSTCTSIFLGLFLAFVYQRKNPVTPTLLMTIAFLPLVVEVIILLVSGDLGVGVAVAGTFSLVRFRSLPAKASDILILFVAIAIGLCTGVGYVFLAIVFTVIFAGIYLVYSVLPMFQSKQNRRYLRITIPEDMHDTHVFDDLFQQYTSFHQLTQMKTISLGTMYQLSYEIELKQSQWEKPFLDEIRARNGNLNVLSSQVTHMEAEL